MVCRLRSYWHRVKLSGGEADEELFLFWEVKLLLFSGSYKIRINEAWEALLRFWADSSECESNNSWLSNKRRLVFSRWRRGAQDAVTDWWIHSHEQTKRKHLHITGRSLFPIRLCPTRSSEPRPSSDNQTNWSWRSSQAIRARRSPTVTRSLTKRSMVLENLSVAGWDRL